MKNYPDTKCCYGYMTLCDKCVPKAPAWVDTSKEIKGLPAPQCEMCKSTK